MSMSRRNFIKRAAFSSIAAAAVLSGANRGAAAIAVTKYATIIDKRDGCKMLILQVVLQLAGTRIKAGFLNLRKSAITGPKPKYEDWSNKRELTNRLTPYNWTYVQHLQVQHRDRNTKLTFPVVACIAIILPVPPSAPLG